MSVSFLSKSDWLPSITYIVIISADLVKNERVMLRSHAPFPSSFIQPTFSRVRAYHHRPLLLLNVWDQIAGEGFIVQDIDPHELGATFGLALV